MNEALKSIAVQAGAPTEVIDTLWFNIFCQKFAAILIDKIEEAVETDLSNE